MPFRHAGRGTEKRQQFRQAFAGRRRTPPERAWGDCSGYPRQGTCIVAERSAVGKMPGDGTKKGSMRMLP